MIDPLQIHHDEQPTYFELQNYFRQESHKSLLARLRKTAVIRDAKGNIIATFSRLDEKHTMDEMYDHPQSFGLESVPVKLTERLYDKADESETFETMSLPEGEGYEHDGPAILQPIEDYTDNQLLDYVDRAIAASREKL